VKYADTVIKRWITLSEIALKIIFPFEQQLWSRLFGFHLLHYSLFHIIFFSSWISWTQLQMQTLQFGTYSKWSQSLRECIIWYRSSNCVLIHQRTEQKLQF